MRNESGTCKIPAILQKKIVSTQMASNRLSLLFMTPHPLFPDETYPAAAVDSTYPVSLPRAFSCGRKKAAGPGRRAVRKESSAAGSIPSLEMSWSLSKFSTYSFSQQATFFA
jgi:hypothetical protein